MHQTLSSATVVALQASDEARGLSKKWQLGRKMHARGSGGIQVEAFCKILCHDVAKFKILQQEHQKLKKMTNDITVFNFFGSRTAEVPPLQTSLRM
jgi:hypothetical protein